MRLRRADDRRVKRSGPGEVLDVRAASGYEARILTALEGLPDVAVAVPDAQAPTPFLTSSAASGRSGGGGFAVSAGAPSLAAAITALTMLW